MADETSAQPIMREQMLAKMGERHMYADATTTDQGEPMSADETPAQPDEDYHDIVTEEYTTGPTTYLRMCPDPSAHDARPAALADQAGETLDPYAPFAALLRSLVDRGEHDLFELYDDHLNLTLEVRAAIDAARAPLLVELAEAGESMYDYQHAATRADEERDQARADRDVAEREMERYRQEAHDLVAELAEAIRERDEARAKVDGGEWQWGWAWPGHAPDWTHSEAVARRAAAVRRPPADVVRRWIGPTTSVGDEEPT